MLTVMLQFILTPCQKRFFLTELLITNIDLWRASAELFVTVNLLSCSLMQKLPKILKYSALTWCAVLYFWMNTDYAD
jgi:hypothetical protein